MSQPLEARPVPDELPPRREPVFNLPAVVIAFAALCIGIQVVRAFILTPEQDLEVILRAAFIPIRYSGAFALDFFAFTSPVTYSLLHGGFGHLAVNMIWLAAFGSPLANRIGTARFLAFWIATSLAAVLAHYLLHAGEAVPLVGASGAISGMMGAAARLGFVVDRRAARPLFAGPVLSVGQALTSRMVVAFLAVWMVVNLLAGFGYLTPDAGGAIAWEAHIGGFVTGFFGLRLFDRRLS